MEKEMTDEKLIDGFLNAMIYMAQRIKQMLAKHVELEKRLAKMEEMEKRLKKLEAQLQAQQQQSQKKGGLF